jgi:hypothetical protein
MKNLLILLFNCLAASLLLAQGSPANRIEVLEKSPTHSVIRLHLNEMQQRSVETPQGPAVVLSMPGGTPILRAGAPDLPKFALSLAIPNTGEMAVTVLESEYEEHFQQVQVAPSKGDLKRNVDPNSVPYTYGPGYAQDAFYPGALADLKQPFILRDQRGQSLWLFPLQYNPVTKVLRVYNTITVRVAATGNAGTNEINTPKSRPSSRVFEQLYRNTFSNYDATATRSAETPEKMLVLVQDELQEALQPLLTWKRQMGIHTEVATLSEIGSSEDAAIHAFVKNYYEENDISYLLIVGDENAFKPEMRSNGGQYACDNCFGYLDGPDYAPEVLVGRLHASTPEQLAIMVNRNLDYEKTPLVDAEQNWCATGMWSASDEGQGIGDDNQADYEHANEWKAAQLADGYEQFWEFYDGNHASISPTPGDPSADQAGNPQNTALVELMNGRGVSVYYYTGHGWEQGLVSGNFNVDAVAALRNTHRYPLCVAVACCAGNFTNNAAGDCLGEAFQRAGDPTTGEAWGGIAGFFSSDFQSWAPPMEGQDGMNQYMVDADGINITPTVGSILAYGNLRMIEDYAEGGELMAGFWNPFGEPSTVLRSRLPQALAASHAPGVFIGASSLSVNCPVEGTLASLYWQGQTLATATVSGGLATLNFPALDNVGDLTLTLSQFNHIPYQATILVTPAAGAFVVNQTITVDDSAGNNNQKADYGEQILLDLTLANVGLDLASATSATLSTSDSKVSITDNSESFGDLAASATLTKAGAFALSVQNDVPDGHLVNFGLNIQFNNGQTYNANFQLKLAAPRLSATAFQINDFQFGDGDGRLESGETALITVENRNIGSSISPATLATLLSSSPWLSISPAVGIGNLNPGGGPQLATFTVQVATDAPQVTLADFDYSLQAGAYSAVLEENGIIINPIVEDFESQNFAIYPWDMGGNKPWVISNGNAYQGNTCARSGTITHNQSSVMNMTLNISSAGTVSFARRVSSEPEYDFLRFYIDAVEIAAWSGNQAWAEVSFPIEAGIHTLTWSYEKDEFASDGFDRAWVDEISLPPYQVVVPTQNPLAASFDWSVQPNPIRGQGWISLELPTQQRVAITLLDMLGRPLRSVQQPSDMPAGDYTIPVDCQNLSAGMYLLQVQTALGVQTRKIAVK